MGHELHFLELTELAQRLRRREVSAAEVPRAQLARIGTLDGDLASFACVTPELALAAAAKADTQSVSDWVSVCALEAAVAHGATYPARKSEYGPILAGVLDAGHAISALDYQSIQLRRMNLHGRFFEHLFRTIDLLLLPVQPFAPLTLDAVRTLGSQPALISHLQRYTAPFDLTGHPTVTLPGGFSETGMPIGFQLAGRDEGKLIQAAAAFQRETNWHRRHPHLATASL